MTSLFGSLNNEDRVLEIWGFCGLPSPLRRVGDQSLDGLELIVSKRIPSHAILLAMSLKMAGSVKVESFEDP